MIDMALDPTTGDLLIVNLGAQLINAVDEVAQNLAIRLRFIRGEWYLNLLEGVPYYEFFFIKQPNQIQVESFLTEEIANTRGIEEILTFQSDYANRKFSVKFSCKALSQTIEIDMGLL